MIKKGFLYPYNLVLETTFGQPIQPSRFCKNYNSEQYVLPIFQSLFFFCAGFFVIVFAIKTLFKIIKYYTLEYLQYTVNNT